MRETAHAPFESFSRHITRLVYQDRLGTNIEKSPKKPVLSKADVDFTTSGIDIAARRAAKAAADQAFADAQGVRDLLRSEGRDISAAGADAIVRGAGTMTKLCAMDLAAMKSLGAENVFLCVCCHGQSESIILPRQSRDRHRESTRKRVAFPYLRVLEQGSGRAARGRSDGYDVLLRR